MAAVLAGVMRLLGRLFDCAWCLVCEFCQVAIVCVDYRCSLSLVFLGGARCLELSLCNTEVQSPQGDDRPVAASSVTPKKQERPGKPRTTMQHTCQPQEAVQS